MGCEPNAKAPILLLPPVSAAMAVFHTGILWKRATSDHMEEVGDISKPMWLAPENATAATDGVGS